MSTLADVCRDGAAPAAARAAAARTLAEVLGMLGRHQDKPGGAGGKALSAMSADELRAEHARLVGLGR